MKRPASSSRLVGSLRNAARQSRPKTGYTLIEILVSTTLSLLLLGAVVAMFGRVGGAVTDSRSMLEAADRLRLAAERLQMDLTGVTVTMSPPRDPANNEGYFEYIEGPIGPVVAPRDIACNSDNGNQADTTIGDCDDILMFTTRSSGRPFVGRFGTGTVQSDVAEVAWFIRGRTLYRRVLLVVPGADLTGIAAPYYRNCDVSARVRGGALVANTLSDLTRRECRFAHSTAAPYDARCWRWSVNTFASGKETLPTLPTLKECSSTGWTTETLPAALPAAATPPISYLDLWTNKADYRITDEAFSTAPGTGTRIADDVILTNVIGFDVQVWDPKAPNAVGGTGAYVNLGYNTGVTTNFSGLGNTPSGLNAASPYLSRVYDTWSTHYEALAGASSNGLDDNNNGVVDDDGEKTTSPPYPYPLRGIQVKLRVFEPDSRQIREVTVVQDFLPQ
ncbi:MAG: hypothetical protein LLG00_16255 [Planctomycetaceae bacterium]|nr:hypothetical protein [Planctomycetaceae bacterium]